MKILTERLYTRRSFQFGLIQNTDLFALKGYQAFVFKLT